MWLDNPVQQYTVQATPEMADSVTVQRYRQPLPQIPRPGERNQNAKFSRRRSGTKLLSGSIIAHRAPPVVTIDIL